MFTRLTVISTALVALLTLIGSLEGAPSTPKEGLVAARAGGVGAGVGRPGGVGARPVARNTALQRTPALSRAAINNRYGAYGAVGYSAGAAYAYPTTTYYYPTTTPPPYP